MTLRTLLAIPFMVFSVTCAIVSFPLFLRRMVASCTRDQQLHYDQQLALVALVSVSKEKKRIPSLAATS